MADVLIEIMGCSPHEDHLKGCRIQFKAKTPRGRGVSLIFKDDSVSFSIPEEELSGHSRNTTEPREMYLYIEVWEEDDPDLTLGSSIPNNNYKFSGLIKYNLSPQLQDSHLSPSIQWLDIYDPINDTSKGKVLLRISTKTWDVKDRISSHDGGGDSDPKSLTTCPENGTSVPIQSPSSNTSRNNTTRSRRIAANIYNDYLD